MKTAAAELVAILHDEGVKHVFVSPGMHTAPLRAAIEEARASGLPHPRPVLCVHEHVALCAAEGHHLASGDPQAIMVHVEGGTLSLGAAIDIAQRDRIPVAVLHGCARDDLAGCLAGSASDPLASPAAHTVGKWTTDLSRTIDLGVQLRRAFQIARAEPTGPTHVLMPRDALGRAAGPLSRRLSPPWPPAPDLPALEKMAELLATAEAPVIVAGRVGRDLSSVHHLALLAETLAAPVVDFRHRVNLPSGHPLNAGIDGGQLLTDADAVLLVDLEVPCLPGVGPLPPHAWVLQIDSDCLKADVPGWMCPVEIAITADSRLALPQLQMLLADRLGPERRRVQERRGRVEAALQATRESWRGRATSGQPADLADAVLAELDRALPPDALVLAEGTASDAALRQLDRPPGHFFRSASSTQGWSMGAAVGAGLGRSGQPVCVVCTDEAFASGLPAAAFWSAHRAAVPFLVVVLDRGGLGPPWSGLPALAPPLEVDPLEPDRDVAGVATASGAEAAVVKTAAEVAGEVERLLAITRDGACAVLDARLQGI